MSRSNPRLRTAATVVIALLLIAGLVAPAFAHAQLLASDPADGAALPTTDRVVLTFNEDINPDFVQVVVSGPDGDLTLVGATVEGALVTQPMTPTSSGDHTLTYRVVSADGHPISGRIGFTLTDVPSAPEQVSTQRLPTTPARPTVMSGAERSDATAADTAVQPGSTADSDWSGPQTWLAGALVLAALAGLAAAGAALARRRRHPEH